MLRILSKWRKWNKVCKSWVILLTIWTCNLLIIIFSKIEQTKLQDNWPRDSTNKSTMLKTVFKMKVLCHWAIWYNLYKKPTAWKKWSSISWNKFKIKISRRSPKKKAKMKKERLISTKLHIKWIQRISQNSLRKTQISPNWWKLIQLRSCQWFLELSDS